MCYRRAALPHDWGFDCPCTSLEGEMLKAMSIDGVRRVADLAKAAREARDEMLRNVPDEDFGEPTPARGPHNPTAFLGFDPLPRDHPARAALRSAIEGLDRG